MPCCRWNRSSVMPKSSESVSMFDTPLTRSASAGFGNHVTCWPRVTYSSTIWWTFGPKSQVRKGIIITSVCFFASYAALSAFQLGERAVCFEPCCNVFKADENRSLRAGACWCDTSRQNQCSHTATARNSGNVDLRVGFASVCNRLFWCLFYNGQKVSCKALDCDICING